MTMIPCVRQQPTSGSNVLKMEVFQWMTMSCLADLHLQDPNL
jgi:hypothetical protein